MFNSKQIKIDESGRINLVNWFSIVFFTSGGGKDRLVDDIDNFVFKQYHEWFKVEAQKAINNCESKNLKLIDEIQDGTYEGVIALAKTINEIKFGNIFVKINEFGDYIKNSDNKRKMLLSMFNQLYYCVVPNKIIKSEVFTEKIPDIPVSVLAYSDYSMFVNNMNNILNTGYARRFMFSFQELKELKFCPLSDDKEREIYQTLEKLGHELFEIFSSIQFGTCYKLTSNAKNLLNEYKSMICELYNSESDLLIQKEINSRELKALKLSCLFACINHCQVYEIQEDDIIQAIETVEFLSQDFKKFLHYRPQKDDKYDKAYKYLREHEGLEFTKTQLLHIFTSHFGFSREPLRRGFNEFIRIIHEIAQEDGYAVIYYDNKCKHGTYFTLVKTEYSIADTNSQRTASISTRYPI